MQNKTFLLHFYVHGIAAAAGEVDGTETFLQMFYFTCNHRLDVDFSLNDSMLCTGEN